MPKAKAYRSVDEIIDIFKITLSTVNSIIKKYKIDHFTGKWKIQIHAKDFYKAYTHNFNPSLFEVWDKKKKIKKVLVKNNNSDIFQKLFGSPYKNPVKKRVVDFALITAKNFH